MIKVGIPIRVVVGLIKDIAGTYQASYALMSGFALLITVAMLILSRMRTLIREGISPVDRISVLPPSVRPYSRGGQRARYHSRARWH